MVSLTNSLLGGGSSLTSNLLGGGGSGGTDLTSSLVNSNLNNNLQNLTTNSLGGSNVSTPTQAFNAVAGQLGVLQSVAGALNGQTLNSATFLASSTLNNTNSSIFSSIANASQPQDATAALFNLASSTYDTTSQILDAGLDPAEIATLQQQYSV